MNTIDTSYKFNNYNNISFYSMRRRTFDRLGNVINCNYTNFNRKDIDWNKLVDFLSSRYSFQDKTNINIYGCSDASDVYTLAISLINKLGFNALKRFSISASDLSENIIKRVQERKIYLHKKDMEYLTSENAMRFFEYDHSEKTQLIDTIEFYPFKVRKEIFNHINFSVKDVIEDVKNHNFSNEVFMFRNGWGFNYLNEQNDIASNLFKNSNNKTLVVIGQSDLYKSGASDFLQENGFKGIENDVFTRAETNYPSNPIGLPKESNKFEQFILFEK